MTRAVPVPNISISALTNLHWWFVSTVPEGHPGWLPPFSQLRWGWGQCQHQCTLWAHTVDDRQHHKAHFMVDSSQGEILSDSSPSGSTLVPPTPHCSSETDLGASTPTTGEQTLHLTGLWQPQSKEEALLNIQGRLWAPQHQSHPLSRGQQTAHTEERHGRHP